MLYMIRLRDVASGAERWLDEAGHDNVPVRLHDRQTADCMALAMSRFGVLELAYVVEIDPEVEAVL